MTPGLRHTTFRYVSEFEILTIDLSETYVMCVLILILT